jgi:hypothetical protein
MFKYCNFKIFKFNYYNYYTFKICPNQIIYVIKLFYFQFAGTLGVLLILQLVGGIIALSMEETLNEPLRTEMIKSQAMYNSSSADEYIWNDVQREVSETFLTYFWTHKNIIY